MNHTLETLQRIALDRRERDIRLGKYPSAKIYPFPDRTTTPSAPPVVEQPPEPVAVPVPELVIHKTPDGKYPSLESIIKVTAAYYNISRQDILSKRRFAPAAHARHVVCYLARKETLLVYEVIGRILGGRDHTSIIHGFQRIEKRLPGDKQLEGDIANLRTILGVAA
jgi:hypothetical protein